MDVKLSIIVPAYNAAKYLPDCLNSILASTYRDFEILLINDGSVDNTATICDCFQQQYPQIRVFHTENQGLPAARNLGLDHAIGNLIGFVDEDDLIAPDMFETLIDAMTPAVQLSTCCYFRRIRNDVSLPQSNTCTAVFYNQVDTAKLILRGAAGPYVWNKLYRKDVLDSHGIRFRPDSQGAEDQFFNAEYLQYCAHAAFVDKQLYFYITTNGSITSTFRQNRTVSNKYISLPQAWRFTADIMEEISADLAHWSQARACMFYQTVLRKIENLNEAYITEAISYVRKHCVTLRHYHWGYKYYLSALLLCTSYPLWIKIFRKGL